MPLRSSISDPIRIDAVKVGECGGRVGMTFCPGKKQPTSVTGGWSRDLALDLGVIADYGTQVLISLLESHELLSLRVSPEEVLGLTSSLGIEWIDSPIVGGIPDEEFLYKWRSSCLASEKLLAAVHRS